VLIVYIDPQSYYQPSCAMKRRAPPGDYAPQEMPVTKAVRLNEPTSARVAALVRKLEVVFRDVGLYKEMLRTRGSDAQGLLDAFQWVCSLDRTVCITELSVRLVVG